MVTKISWPAGAADRFPCRRKTLPRAIWQRRPACNLSSRRRSI